MLTLLIPFVSTFNRVNVARCYLKLQKFLESARWSSRAIDQDPARETAHFMRAKACMALGKLKHAQRDLDAAMRINSSSSAIRSGMAELRELQKAEKQKSRKLVKMVLDHISNSSALDQLESM